VILKGDLFMKKFGVKDGLKKKLRKISKKDNVLHQAVEKKIKEILDCENIDHYKNLRKPMQNYKRVHVKSSFVLIFEYDVEKDYVVFCNLDHHDGVYK